MISENPFIRTLTALYAADTVAGVFDAAMQAAATLVPTNLASISVVRLPEGCIAALLDRDQPLMPSLLPAFERLAGTHPLVNVATGDLSVSIISRSVGLEAFHASAIYQEFYAQIDAQDQVAAPFIVSPTIRAALAMNFTERVSDETIEVIRWFQPHLRRAYQLALVQESQQHSGHERGLLLADYRGNVVYVSPAADRLLLDGGVVAGQARPAGKTIASWFRRLGPEAPAGATFRWRSITATLVRPVSRQDGYCLALTGQPDEATDQLVPILERLAAGDTDEEIARALGYQPRSVSKRVERLYAQKGFKNRAAAAAWFTRTWHPVPADS